MKQIIILLFLGPFLLQAQGLNWSTRAELEDANDITIMDYGYSSSSLPASHDMLKYAPPVEDQNGGTCVGFAAGYCAHSTMLNKALGITNTLQKDMFAMDPYFLYSLANSKIDQPCEEGMTFTQFFKGLENIGNMRALYPPNASCDFDWLDYSGELNDELIDNLSAAFPFRIDDYGQIDLEKVDWMNTMKYYLANDVPIVIGAFVDEDFQNLSSESNGLWNYRSEESETLGGHAMCILGYNDYKYGGAFLVRNSWGTTFGSNGNVWIKYSDFKKVIGEAWVIYPDESLENSYSSSEYSFNLKSTLDENLDYRLIKASDGDIYEGFYAEDRQVWAFHLINNGAVYFGQFINYVKHGVGYFCTPDGELYEARFYNGEFIEGQELGYSSNDSKLAQEFMSSLESNTDSQLFNGDIPSLKIVK